MSDKQKINANSEIVRQAKKVLQLIRSDADAEPIESAAEALANMVLDGEEENILEVEPKTLRVLGQHLGEINSRAEELRRAADVLERAADDTRMALLDAGASPDELAR